MGLDTAAPDHSVEDGKCGELHNLRFSGGAWRNVHPFVTKYRLKYAIGYKILYHHPSTGDNLYIAERTSTDEHFVSLIKIEDNEISLVQDIYDMTLAGNPQLSISHFGKVLIINNVTTKEITYYLYNVQKYENVDLSFSNITFSVTSLGGNPSVDLILENFDTGNDPEKIENYGFKGSGIAAYEKVCSVGKKDWYFRDFREEENDFRGEFAIFLALRMEDGSIIYRTPPQIVNTAQWSLSRNKIPKVERLGEYPIKDGNTYAYVAWEGNVDNLDEAIKDVFAAEYHRFYKAYCRLSLSLSENNIIHDVAIYTTRLYSFFNKVQGESFHNSIDIMLEPFYLMETFGVNKLKSPEYIIGYDDFRNIEQKPMFVPTLSLGDVYAERMFEYNDRLHLISASSRKPRLLKDSLKENYDSGVNAIIADWIKNDVLHYSIYRPIYEPYFSIAQDKLITFPGRITTLHFVNDSEEEFYDSQGKIDMMYSAGLDLSYYTSLTTRPFFKYKPIEIKEYEGVLKFKDDDFTNIINEPNRIQVSEANNCFIFPYENSYRIGSNTSHIITANSAAIEMSDAKFGEFPLYVFTDEGVFAMQSGSGSVLYSAIVPISYDKAIQPNTLAVNYNVLFVTARGIMALSSQGVNLISESLNNPDGTIPEWLKTTEFTHISRYNEVLATDRDSGIAYVYSLDNRVWSTRDLDYNTKLNNGEVVHGNYIINLNEEIINETRIGVQILTRPIKLGSMELKRLETFVLRFESASTQIINIQLSGSVDTVNWINFREVSVFTNRDIIIRRVPMSAKYLRVQVSGAVSADVKIIAMEMEFYLRMLHRMR